MDVLTRFTPEQLKALTPEQLDKILNTSSQQTKELVEIRTALQKINISHNDYSCGSSDLSKKLCDFLNFNSTKQFYISSEIKYPTFGSGYTHENIRLLTECDLESIGIISARDLELVTTWPCNVNCKEKLKIITRDLPKNLVIIPPCCLKQYLHIKKMMSI